MAIYHLSAKVITRSAGRSVIAAAAYRCGESLTEEATGITYDYTRKRGIEHSEILAPHHAPHWVHDRRQLWNAVDAIEKRKDAQLAREIEVGLPLELQPDTQVQLLRDFIRREYVSQGMIADFSVHLDNPNNPHAHILLTLRSVTEKGFGPKERAWNDRTQLLRWRAGWEELTNEHLARAGLSVRIDHRSLKAQGLDLIPGRKIGVSLERQQSASLPRGIAERVAEQRRIAHDNGRLIIADPTAALKALTHQQATFSDRDIARFLHTRTDGADQFRLATLKVKTSPDLVALGCDDRGLQRYTSREMRETEEGTLHRAEQSEAHAHLTASSAIPARTPASEYAWKGGRTHSMADIDTAQQNAAERWRAKQRARELGPPTEATPARSHSEEREHDVSARTNPSKSHRRSHPGLEDDLDV